MFGKFRMNMNMVEVSYVFGKFSINVMLVEVSYGTTGHSCTSL